MAGTAFFHRIGRLGYAVAAGCLVMPLLTASVSRVPAAVRPQRALPFAPGEKLTFVLKWAAIPAGEAVLEVLPMENMDGRPAHHFRLTAKSNSFIDIFYKVRDRIDSFVDADMKRSVGYLHKQHEGSRRRNARVTFDWQTSTARYSDEKTVRKAIKLPPDAFDPLSVFYHVRTLDLKENSTLEGMVTDGKKAVKGEARIIRRERVTVPVGTFDTFLLIPDTKDVGGVFEKSKDSNIKLWVTADERRIPVKIASKVAVGNFVGELVSVQ